MALKSRTWTILNHLWHFFETYQTKEAICKRKTAFLARVVFGISMKTIYQSCECFKNLRNFLAPNYTCVSIEKPSKSWSENVAMKRSGYWKMPAKASSASQTSPKNGWKSNHGNMLQYNSLARLYELTKSTFTWKREMFSFVTQHIPRVISIVKWVIGQRSSEKHFVRLRGIECGVCVFAWRPALRWCDVRKSNRLTATLIEKAMIRTSNLETALLHFLAYSAQNPKVA